MRSQRKRLWIREIKFKEEAGLVDRRKKMAEIQVDYKRDMQNSYLVIETEEIPERTYRLPMLMNNRIEGLLEIELRTVDEKNVYYYDISSRQSFACIYEKKTLNSPELKKLIRDIISIITRGKEYLLDENDFIIRPEYIYLSIPACEVSLCYLPGYQRDMRGQLSGLFEELMNKVNYKDEEAVLLIYSLYMAGKEEHCTFDSLLALLRERAGRTVPVKEESPRGEPEPPVSVKAGGSKEAAKGPGDVIPKKFHENPEAAERDPDRRNSETDGGRKSVFISQERRRKNIIFGAAGVILAFLAVIYAGARLYESGTAEPEKLYGAAGVLVISAILSIRAFTLAFRRRGPEIRPLYLGTEEFQRRPDREDEILAQTDSLEAERERPVFEEAEERTVILTGPAGEEYCLIPLGRHTDEKTLLDEFPYYIGKWKEHVNLVLDDSTVSRFHAKITKEEDGLYLTDLNSTNGTFLNQDRLAPNERRRLNPGDELAFAAKRYQFGTI